MTRADGTIETWAGALPSGAVGPGIEWDRPPMERPTTKLYREMAPGPDLYLTAKLHLRNPERRDG